MKYTSGAVVQELRSETKVYKGIMLQDFFFIIIYMMAAYVLREMVSPSLRVLYMIFSALTGLYLTSKSRSNPGRRQYEALLLFITKDRAVYRPVINYSLATERQKKELENEKQKSKRY